MILEGIVTTKSVTGEINIAPMGPTVDSKMRTFTLRPFRSAQTYRNLCAHGEGVFHVTDDVLLLARAALGAVEPMPSLLPASAVDGMILAEACRCYEFRVITIDDSSERSVIECAVVHSRTLREFFGFNRAKHAVVEAAILATRTDFLPIKEILGEFAKLSVIVQKTGGPREVEAYEFLARRVEAVSHARGVRIQ